MTEIRHSGELVILPETPLEIAKRVTAYPVHLALIERVANFDCFKPWGVLCNQASGGEEPCEACQAKEFLTESEAK